MNMDNVTIFVSKDPTNPLAICGGFTVMNTKDLNGKKPGSIDEMVLMGRARNGNHYYPVTWIENKVPDQFGTESWRHHGRLAYEAGHRFIRLSDDTYKSVYGPSPEKTQKSILRTIFLDTGGFISGQAEDGKTNAERGVTIQDLIDWAVKRRYKPAYWAEEGTQGYGGNKYQAVLREESIAAGRTISFVNGKYVQQIPRIQSSNNEPGQPTMTVATVDPNAAMISRDGPARVKPTPVVVRKEPKAPAFFSNLVRESGPMTHLVDPTFGSGQ